MQRDPSVMLIPTEPVDQPHRSSSQVTSRLISLAELEQLKRDALRAVGARFRMLPIQQILKVRSAGQPRAVAGARGFWWRRPGITQQYAGRVASLDIWENDPRLRPALLNRFPNAEVRITDSYEEVRRTSKRYDFVMIDNSIWAEEHFPLFPAVFNVVSEKATMAIRVIPRADRLTRRRYPSLFDEQHLARRRAFYRTDSPAQISLDDLGGHYCKLADDSGLVVDWRFWVNCREIHGVVPRRTSMHFLVLGLRPCP